MVVHAFNCLALGVGEEDHKLEVNLGYTVEFLSKTNKNCRGPQSAKMPGVSCLSWPSSFLKLVGLVMFRLSASVRVPPLWGKGVLWLSVQCPETNTG